MFTYRRAGNKDFKFICSLFIKKNTEFYDTKAMSLEDLKKLTASKNRFDYILLNHDKRIGWFNIHKNIQGDEIKFGIIIDHRYWGKGFGQKTLEFIKKEARLLGIKKIKITVFDKNKRAINLYHKAGFKKTNYLLVMEYDL